MMYEDAEMTANSSRVEMSMIFFFVIIVAYACENAAVAPSY